MSEACDLARQRIDQFYEESIAPSDWDLLVQHLRRCDACGLHFQNARDLACAVSVGPVGPDELTPLESKRLGGLIEARSHVQSRATPPWRSRVAVLGGLAGLAAAAGAAAVLHGRSASDGFTDRGTVDDSSIGFDLLCLAPNPNVDTTSLSHSGGTCPAGSYLKPVVSSRKPMQVSVVAFDQSLTQRFVSHASVGSATAFPINGNVQVLAGDNLMFVAIFSEHATADSVVQNAIDELRSNKDSFAVLQKLPIAEGRQIVVHVRATPSEKQ
jgi:hypothetical protein